MEPVAPPALPIRTLYILIDYENIKPTTLRGIERQPAQVYIFWSRQCDDISLTLASRAHQFVCVDPGGKNALDFVIAFTIGQLQIKDPDGEFVIISNDKDYDPLISNLKRRKVCIRRVDREDLARAFAASKPQKTTPSLTTPLHQKTQEIVEWLGKNQKALPKTEAKLKNFIKARYHKGVSEADVEQMLKTLKTVGAAGYLVVKEKSTPAKASSNPGATAGTLPVPSLVAS